jgi:glycosyltransferase involved in cell wall biosynthesis
VDLDSRIGAEQPQVLVVAKGGRDFRYDRLVAGQEAPREFFYGYLDLERAGIPAAMMSSAAAMPGLLGRAADCAERAFAAVTALGVRPLSAWLSLPILKDVEAVISFTDGFSLSLGLGLGPFKRRPVLIGGFHGLTDIEGRGDVRARGLVRRLISRALTGLDHAFFFGPADRDEAVARYGVPRGKTSVIRFGVDSGFWRPLPDVGRRNAVVAVGQDINRDFDLLARAPGRNPTHIITRRKVDVPAGADHVTITTGDFFGSTSMTDEELRRLYNMSAAVIVPLKDVNQPTGYSVTLQAMSCGRPVVLSRIRGLWAPELLVDGENCLLVPPGDAEALGAAITRIRTDQVLAERLAANGRATIERHFGLDAIGKSTVELARTGLRLARARRDFMVA